LDKIKSGFTIPKQGTKFLQTQGKVYIKCLDKFKSGITTSKQGTKVPKTQAGMYGYVVYRVYKTFLDKSNSSPHHKIVTISYKHSPKWVVFELN
jgi:hypothetical protein